ncbi:MAG: CoA transferase, partial [Nocardioides sp.]|jgi:crotonobetainyl-CoA:carnitine CoA-transferase CaiB-like acyl-CoA transferase
MRDIVKRRTTQDWLAYCREAGIPAVEMATLQQLVDGLPLAEHPVAGSYRTLPPTANFSLTPATTRRPAPRIGEHTDQVLDGGSPWADERTTA